MQYARVEKNIFSEADSLVSDSTIYIASEKNLFIHSAFGERSRGWPLGHRGDEGPHLRDDGGVSGWFSSGGPRVRFLP